MRISKGASFRKAFRAGLAFLSGIGGMIVAYLMLRRTELSSAQIAGVLVFTFVMFFFGMGTGIYFAFRRRDDSSRGPEA